MYIHKEREREREYNIPEEKIVAATTDSASDFAKAFQIFGIKEKRMNDCRRAFNGADLASDSCIYTAMSDIVLLHLCYCPHTSNLCVIVDSNGSLRESIQLTAVHGRIIAKRNYLWKMTVRTNTAEIIRNIGSRFEWTWAN